MGRWTSRSNFIQVSHERYQIVCKDNYIVYSRMFSANRMIMEQLKRKDNSEAVEGLRATLTLILWSHFT